ncbi:MAG: vWA domain-containing protein [Candidatus Chromulinivorax sp.]
MQLFFRFAYLEWFYAALLFIVALLLIRRYYSRLSLYTFPLTGYVVHHAPVSSYVPSYILYTLRVTILIILAMLVGKPQLVDQKSKVIVEGIDIMTVLDISGSMACFDDLKDRRTRIQIAKQEGIRFIEKRHNDAVGLVVFGNYAMLRCPLTPDKNMLKTMIEAISMTNGDPIHEGTVISQAVITAARHLQKSKAASKVIILLTDGEPSQNDFSPTQAIAIAKSFGIKVYTIGIGNNGLSMQEHPLFGVVQYKNHFDTKLLQMLAQETGGLFFDARKAQDISKIYDEIDALEKTKMQDTIYMKYHDFFVPLLWIVLLLVFVELILSTLVWVIL